MLDVDGRFFITGTPGRHDWLASLRANARSSSTSRAAASDVDATAAPVEDRMTRRRVLEHLSATWFCTRTPIEDLVETAPMVEVHVEERRRRSAVRSAHGPLSRPQGVPRRRWTVQGPSTAPPRDTNQAVVTAGSE